MNKIYTIGHANYDFTMFMSLLGRHRIDVIVDVRSLTVSKYAPQFNKAVLEKNLGHNGYRWLGEELGDIRNEKLAYSKDGIAEFSLISELFSFKDGIKRLKKIFETSKVALLGIEPDPLLCHRTLLVAEELKDFNRQHILGSGNLESHEDALQRLVKETGSETVAEAIENRSKVIQHSLTGRY